jgi:hypothetical protein
VYGVLGDLLNNMGDGDAAQAAYRTACASGDPNVAGAAERRVSEPPPVLDFAAAIERARSTSSRSPRPGHHDDQITLAGRLGAARVTRSRSAILDRMLAAGNGPV